LQEVAVADISNELMYELLKRIHHEMSETRQDVSEVKKELNVIRGHLVAMQSDIHNIYGILVRHDERLDRIDRRLELRELAEAQKPFDPSS
jgi:predicted  nucleic acid-binding Zn-ribbon protein